MHIDIKLNFIFI